MARWFRVYDDAVDDPKVQRLPPKLFKAWFNLLCLASQNGGVIPHPDDVAFKLRITGAQADDIIGELEERNLLDVSEGHHRPHNWDARQHQSDISTPRVRRFRERNLKRDETVSETPPDTEAETEQRSSLRSDARKRATQLPDDWRVDEQDRAYASQQGWNEQKISEEEERFRDHARASGRRQVDWRAAWRNWVTSHRSPHAQHPPH
jgi:hypothetical protein